MDDLIFINDGIVKLRVKAKEAKDLVCVVESGEFQETSSLTGSAGFVSDHKGCNIPRYL